MGKQLTKETIAKRTIKSMNNLGVYKPEFEPIIIIYAGLRYQYDILTKKYEKSNYKFETITAQGVKKAPIVTTLESLRKDILAYSAQLGLTAAGLRKLKEEALKDKRPVSPIDRLMDEAE